MYAKSLTLTAPSGLAVSVLLPSLQRALETKRQNILLKFRINCVANRCNSIVTKLPQMAWEQTKLTTELKLRLGDIVVLKGFNESYNILSLDV